MSASPAVAFSLQAPEAFLQLLKRSGGTLDLRSVALTEMFALAAMGGLARVERESALKLEWQPGSNTQRFASAGGLDDVIRGVDRQVDGEEGRMVRLRRILDEEQIFAYPY